MLHGKVVVLLADCGWKYLSTNLWTTDYDDLPDDIDSKVWWQPTSPADCKLISSSVWTVLRAQMSQREGHGSLFLQDTLAFQCADRFGMAGDDHLTQVTYYWDVQTTRPWMNLLAPVARPIFKWNHDQVMEDGRRGLIRLLAQRRESAAPLSAGR